VHTDEGIVGVHGEACLEGKARVVETAVREFDELLGGQVPRRGHRDRHPRPGHVGLGCSTDGTTAHAQPVVDEHREPPAAGRER
jgi:hypothetical protein